MVLHPLKRQMAKGQIWWFKAEGPPKHQSMHKRQIQKVKEASTNGLSHCYQHPLIQAQYSSLIFFFLFIYFNCFI